MVRFMKRLIHRLLDHNRFNSNIIRKWGVKVMIINRFIIIMSNSLEKNRNHNRIMDRFIIHNLNRINR